MKLEENLRNIFFAAVAVSAIAVPAAAQETDAERFAGLKVEAIGGYDSVGISIDESVLGVEAEESEDGFLYGVGIGYDFAVGPLGLVGVEAEYTDSGVGSSISANNENIDGTIYDGTASLDASKDHYVGARIGMTLTPNTLFYVKGGYSMASADFDANGSVDGEALSYDLDVDFDGVRLGGGAEVAFNQNMFVKVEYRYSNYGGGDIGVDGVEFDVDQAFDYFDLDRHQVAVGVGARF